MEEEGRLNDPHLRDNFITRVFAYRRLTALRDSAPRPADLVAFHTVHKYLLLAHSPAHNASFGRLVADLKRVPRAEWLERYGREFLDALRAKATTKKHVNVLQHLMGFFKDQLTAGEKQELLGLIANYARGPRPADPAHHAPRLRDSRWTKVYLGRSDRVEYRLLGGKHPGTSPQVSLNCGRRR